MFGIPNNIFIMFGVLALLWILINRTELGQQIQAVGGNIEAARLSGIRVDIVKAVAFMAAGVCAALTGILLASLIGSGTTSAADGYLMNSFAAVFLGSATLKDGEFHIPGTLIGVLIIGIGFNGLAIFGVPTFYQYVFQGAILILAVGLSTVARRLAKN
jgi:ribose transport system permease protein